MDINPQDMFGVMPIVIKGQLVPVIHSALGKFSFCLELCQLEAGASALTVDLIPSTLGAKRGTRESAMEDVEGF